MFDDEEYITLQINTFPLITYVTIDINEKIGVLCKKLGVSNLFYFGIKLDKKCSFHHYEIISADILDIEYKFFSLEEISTQNGVSISTRNWIENKIKDMNYHSSGELFSFLKEEGLLKETCLYISFEVKTIIPKKGSKPSIEPLPCPFH